MNKPPTCDDSPAVTVAELLDQASERLDALCAAGLHRDPALFELWRTVANLHAAVRILADDHTPTDPTPKAL